MGLPVHRCPKCGVPLACIGEPHPCPMEIPAVAKAMDRFHKKKVEIERDAARADQAKVVMPMIGPLLDAWDGIPNDLKSDGEMAELRKHLDAIKFTMDKDW